VYEFEKWSDIWVLDYPKGTTSNRFTLFFCSNYQAENRTGPAFPFAQSVMMLKIARQAYQAIFVGGNGLEPKFLLIFNQKNQFRSPIDPASPFVEIVEKIKTA